MRIGGFIADFVKGSNFKKYPAKIRQGIVLHRQIDTFTDNHPIVRELINKMRPEFGRYAAIVLDMYFDYFLATNFTRYSKTKLWLFSVCFSISALLHYFYLPKRVKRFIIHFALSNRLYKYSKMFGLNESLYIMSVYRIKALEPEKCIDYLQSNKVELENSFLLFFEELIQFVDNEISK
jgi:acyl carrier protein phosphodiesterase